MQNTLKITILKKDILLNNYMFWEKCPITKALHRAGRKDLFDTGFIENGNGYPFIPSNNDSYINLLTKLYGMYNYQFNQNCGVSNNICPKIPVRTFTHILIW